MLHGQAEMTKGCVLCVTICNGAFLPLDNTVTKGCAIYLQIYAQVQIGCSSKKLQKILSVTADPAPSNQLNKMKNMDLCMSLPSALCSLQIVSKALTK